MSFEAWTLLRPAWLLALPLIAWLAWRRGGRSVARGPWQSLVDPQLQTRVLAAAGNGHRWPAGLAALLAVVALAGPAVRDHDPDVAWRADAARVLLVDLSPAMAEGADDGAAPKARLGAVLATLLGALPEGDTALAVYAESPFVVVPLTRDRTIIARYLPELDPAVMPRAGDEPARALGFAADLLQRSGARRRDIVWITAGASFPQAWRREALRGVGVQLIDLGDRPEGGLGALAADEGWGYLRPAAGGAAVEAAAARLAPNGWRATFAPAGERWRDLGPWLLLALLPLAALAFGSRLGGAAGLLAVSLLAGVGSPAQADDGEAYRRWQAGDFAAAAADFSDARWRAAALHRAGRYAEAASTLLAFDDVDAHYNRGVALARAGELAGALAAFEAALARKPDDGDAQFNRDLLRELMSPPPDEPPPGGPPQAGPASRRPDPQREASLLAEQWLRQGNADEGGLLRRRLALEQARRDKDAGRQ